MMRNLNTGRGISGCESTLVVLLLCTEVSDINYSAATRILQKLTSHDIIFFFLDNMDGSSREDDTSDDQYSVEITPETLYTVIGVCAGGLLAIVLLILGAVYCQRRKWKEVSHVLQKNLL